MKVLVIDTETTGLPEDHSAPVTDSAKWPYIIQLSYIIFDTEKKEILEYTDHIIRLPSTINIAPESIAVHQITAARSQAEGIPIKQALLALEENLKDVDIMVGHNILFDKRMLMAEFNRNQMRNSFYQNGTPILEYCTMKRTSDLCKYPAINKKTGESYWKWPSLSELHAYLFGVKPRGTHNAIADVMICLRCYVMINHKYDIAIDNEVKLVFRILFANYTGGDPPGPPN